ncbi:DUF2273 domain-containing protein [Brochothrix thermosphacta]|uniref:DUF2273 domain-containing protein n=1 Tax=Brochothrix thermosphacta TaxID=2756 RepID=UPI0009BCA1F8|nr:DUF2273 domain-containing protein [Brochothrix thermosphacta]
MKELIKENQYALIGASVGFVIALLFITLGFFKTILLLFLTFCSFMIGYYLNKRIKYLK